MKKIITISREFGSGGRSIGKAVAERLHYHYYDKELIEKLQKNQVCPKNTLKKNGIFKTGIIF